jgi:hypothetical protein
MAVDFKTTAIRHPSASKSPQFARFPVRRHTDRPCVTGSVTVRSTRQRRFKASFARRRHVALFTLRRARLSKSCRGCSSGLARTPQSIRNRLGLQVSPTPLFRQMARPARPRWQRQRRSLSWTRLCRSQERCTFQIPRFPETTVPSLGVLQPRHMASSRLSPPGIIRRRVGATRAEPHERSKGSRPCKSK